jgi:hypothetical protein
MYLLITKSVDCIESLIVREKKKNIRPGFHGEFFPVLAAAAIMLQMV